LRNDANGMFVMLDVGGLAPGNYLVGIDDPSVLNAGGNTGTAVPNNVQRTPTQQGRTINPPRTDVPETPGIAPFGGDAAPADAPRGGDAPAGAAPAGTTPSGASGGGAAPAGSGDGAAPAGGGGSPQGRIEPSNQQIPRTVLAQVADTPVAEPREPNVAAPGTPGSGTLVRPPDAPGTGQGNPEEAIPTGTSGNDNGIPSTGVNNDVIDGGAGSGIPGGGVGPSLRIGTLTVDQSGTGRLQQVVESVRVQDVVGQAIAIYSQNATPQTTLPPNLDATTDPTTGVQRTPARPTTTGPVVAGQPATTNVTGGTATGPNNVNGNGPVAGGIIRLMSATPDGTGTTTTDQNIPSPQNPNVPQNSVVPATPDQLPVR
jgi:hypothetical protein